MNIDRDLAERLRDVIPEPCTNLIAEADRALTRDDILVAFNGGRYIEFCLFGCDVWDLKRDSEFNWDRYSYRIRGRSMSERRDSLLDVYQTPNMHSDLIEFLKELDL